MDYQNYVIIKIILLKYHITENILIGEKSLFKVL